MQIKVKIFPQVIRNDVGFESDFIPAEPGKKLNNLISELINNLKKDKIKFNQYRSRLLSILSDTGLLPNNKQFTIRTDAVKSYLNHWFRFIKDEDILEESGAIVVTIPEECLAHIEYCFNCKILDK